MCQHPTELRGMLMKRDITEVYICGLALDVCVGMSGFGFLFGTFVGFILAFLTNLMPLLISELVHVFFLMYTEVHYQHCWAWGFG